MLLIFPFSFLILSLQLFPAISPNRQILWILKVEYLVTEPTIFRPSGCNSTLHLRSSQQCSIAAALWNEPITLALLEITVFTQVIIDRRELLERTLKFVGAHVKNADEISRLSEPPSSIMCQSCDLESILMIGFVRCAAKYLCALYWGELD